VSDPKAEVGDTVVMPGYKGDEELTVVDGPTGNRFGYIWVKSQHEQMRFMNKPYTIVRKKQRKGAETNTVDTDAFLKKQMDRNLRDVFG